MRPAAAAAAAVAAAAPVAAPVAAAVIPAGAGAAEIRRWRCRRLAPVLATLITASVALRAPAAMTGPGGDSRAAATTAYPGAAGAAPTAGSTQGPKADWRTLATPHFRVHYPAASAAWARSAAARLEAIRTRVGEEVGYTPEGVVDVLVLDPVAAANGFAYPLLGWPRLVLWTSPPGPDSVIGDYRDWTETLLVHEDTHLAHLLRPSRNPLLRSLAHLVPLGPISGAPRWVVEGYATVIEGRLTGSGRPHGDLRAAVLRRWAMAGRLPSYRALAADDSSYLGMSMAYLAGSAYLEWLEERAGPGSLRDLWARMTARHRRDFAAAFRGVFGAAPQELYGRFTAELTWRALEVERRIAEEEGGTGFREGEEWMELAWQTGRPAVSPDGESLAVVLDAHDEPAELAVYATAVDEEAVATRDRQRREIAERDPEDVATTEPQAPPHERLATLFTRDDAEPSAPRWMPDGESLLVVRYLPDAEGFLHPDLFRWWPADGALDRLTRGADLRDEDPSPDGSWAVAVHDRHGLSQLVRVELPAPAATGRRTVDGEAALSALTAPAVDVVYDGPRISPDGTALAFARHRAGVVGRWELVVRDLASGEESILPVPPQVAVSSPAWGRAASAGTLFAVGGSGGFIDLYAFRPAAGGGWSAERLTLTRGAALAPTVSGDGTALFFLSLEPDGLILRRLDLAGDAAPAAGAAEQGETAGSGGGEQVAGFAGAPFGPPADLADLTPAVPPAATEAPPTPLAELPADRPFGRGRQELLPLVGGTASAAGDAFELAVRSGDLLGRLDLLAVGALAGGALPEGGALVAAWRGPTPLAALDLGAHLFQVAERPSRQGLAALPAGDGSGDAGRSAVGPGLGVGSGLAGGADVERSGLELAATWDRLVDGDPLQLSGGVYAGSVEARPPGGLAAPGAGRRDERSAFTAARWEPGWSRGRWAAQLRLDGRFDAGTAERGPGARGADRPGGGADGSWQRWRGGLRAELDRDDSSLALSWTRGEAAPDAPPWQLFQVGGVATSVLPGSVLAARVLEPAVPAASLTGDGFERQGASLATGLLPLPIFYSRYRVTRGGAESAWLEVYGTAVHARVAPVPLLRLPQLDLTVGVARIAGAPFDGETSWWVSAAWRP